MGGCKFAKGALTKRKHKDKKISKQNRKRREYNKKYPLEEKED